MNEVIESTSGLQNFDTKSKQESKQLLFTLRLDG